MTWKRIRIGDFIETSKELCNISDLTPEDVSGISCDKDFFSPARQIAENTSNYKIVPNGYFACNLLHVGRDRVLPVALNFLKEKRFVSPNYYVFKLTENSFIQKEFFMMMLTSSEMDRYFWYNTEASVHDRVDWDTFCNTELIVPSIDEQIKLSNIYLELKENTEICLKTLKTLNNLINLYIKGIIINSEFIKLGHFIEPYEEINLNNQYGADNLYGISAEKVFTHSMTNLRKVNLSNFYIAPPGCFAYNNITSRNKECLSVTYNMFDKKILVSNRYKLFKIKSNKLLEEYLYLYFTLEEFDRYARYNSWGCAREVFDWEPFINLEIPLPPIEKQRKIAHLFNFIQLKKKKFKEYQTITKKFCSIVFKHFCQKGYVNIR